MSFCSFFGGEVFKDHFKTGLYVCAQCGHQLFSSRSKYEHSSPWPAFTETVLQDSVSKHEERPGAFKTDHQSAALSFPPLRLTTSLLLSPFLR
uniref:MsrB domain-containing protein n=1 Tax=Oncorhynchus tshawytscha TaxID=74940 RepID=A0AAZ3S9X2_ONCTS